MRLTNREKVMLIGFVVVLALVGAVYYLYLPIYDALRNEEERLYENLSTLQSIEKI